MLLCGARFLIPAFFVELLKPLFKALSKLWSGLQDKAELLNILNNISINLQPFITSQAKIFSEAHLDGLLESSEVKADDRVLGDRIDPGEMKSHDWLLPETTASFNELPLQYNGVCGYTVTRDGLLLPGPLRFSLNPSSLDGTISGYTRASSSQSSARMSNTIDLYQSDVAQASLLGLHTCVDCVCGDFVMDQSGRIQGVRITDHLQEMLLR
ncbi:cilia- and flagella-associated protein 206-like [Labrus bergylta]|uniref:cilia- and flagella-associated protein 206-like n=1 Tax=Labrus bergylta TaxID=56723 RepID=UPI00331402A2